MRRCAGAKTRCGAYTSVDRGTATAEVPPFWNGAFVMNGTKLYRISIFRRVHYTVTTDSLLSPIAASGGGWTGSAGYLWGVTASKRADHGYHAGGSP